MLRIYICRDTFLCFAAEAGTEGGDNPPVNDTTGTASEHSQGETREEDRDRRGEVNNTDLVSVSESSL